MQDAKRIATRAGRGCIVGSRAASVVDRIGEVEKVIVHMEQTN